MENKAFSVRFNCSLPIDNCYFYLNKLMDKLSPLKLLTVSTPHHIHIIFY